VGDDTQKLLTVADAQAMVTKAVTEAVSHLSRAPRPFKVFGLNASRDYAEGVVKHLGIELTPHTEKCFEDGECYIQSGPDWGDSAEGNVRGHNVFVIQSIYSDEEESVADKFVKLCFFCGSLKDASAHEVIPIIPHLGWARQDRKTQSRAPITTKYVARMLEANKIERVLLLDVHNLAAEQNAFTVPIDVLEANNLFAEWFACRLMAEGKTKKIRVLSPDSGGLGRCGRFRLALLKRLRALGVVIDDIEIVIFDKVRVKGEVIGGHIIGDVEDADVLVFDDMISTASTMKKSCNAVIAQKGRVYAICASHGLFCGKANDVLSELDAKIVVADTIKPWRLTPENKAKLHVVETTKMVAEAITRIHRGSGSISALLST
jgi:ribose-phosphate pyrophosphokinase